jgi:hypothetical protein
MNDSLFFATFDPLYTNAPETCSLCIAQPPAFNYEYCVEQQDGHRHYIKGFAARHAPPDFSRNWRAAKPRSGLRRRLNWKMKWM